MVPGAGAEERLAAAALEVLLFVDVLVKGCLLDGEMGIWLWGLEPKPIEGDTFSQPCRAEPVILEILCMSSSWSWHVQNGNCYIRETFKVYDGKKEKKRKVDLLSGKRRKKRGVEVGTKSRKEENVGTTEKLILLF